MEKLENNEGMPLQEDVRRQIISASSVHLPKWRMNVEALIGYYDKINETSGKEFRDYEFKKQQYFEDNNTYKKLKSFCKQM